MITTHALTISVMLNWDALTNHVSAMIITHAPLIAAIQSSDVSTNPRSVTMESFAPEIHAIKLLESASMNLTATFATFAQLVLAKLTLIVLIGKPLKILLKLANMQNVILPLEVVMQLTKRDALMFANNLVFHIMLAIMHNAN
jgi:hypothetical protein